MKIGITGGVGSGKSTVSRILESMGYAVFYSDKAAKDIIQNNPEVQKEIVDLLGQEAFVNGQYNVPFVSSKIFQDGSLKEKLNGIVHPRVRQAFIDFEKQHQIVFNEAAIMFETGLYRSLDHTILVVSPMEMRIERTMKRDGISRDQVELRIRNQWSDEQKKELASSVLINDEKTSLISQVNSLLKHLI